MRVRPSSMDRFMTCASSALPPDAPHDPEHDAQRGGSAAHYAIEQRLLNGEEPDLEQIAAAYGLLHVADLSVPYSLWKRAWAQLEPYFPDPMTEVRVNGELTSGTIDLLSTDTNRATFADWKAGYVERDHEHQLTAYAHAIRDVYGMPSEGVIRGAVVWLRGEAWRVYEWTDADLDAWEGRVQAQHLRIGEHFAAGEHCGYCPRRLECPTRSAHMRAAGEALESARGHAMTGERLAELYPRVSDLEKAIKEYRAALHVALADGPLRVDDERELSLQPRTRSTIKAREAWPVLTRHLTDDERAAAMSVSKKEVEEAVKSRAVRGQKGKAALALIEELREAGAIETSEHMALSMGRRKAKQ